MRPIRVRCLGYTPYSCPLLMQLSIFWELLKGHNAGWAEDWGSYTDRRAGRQPTWRAVRWVVRGGRYDRHRIGYELGPPPTWLVWWEIWLWGTPLMRWLKRWWEKPTALELSAFLLSLRQRIASPTLEELLSEVHEQRQRHRRLWRRLFCWAWFVGLYALILAANAPYAGIRDWLITTVSFLIGWIIGDKIGRWLASRSPC